MLFDLAALREAMVVKRIHRLWWIDTRDMIADGLAKGVIARDPIIALCHSGVWTQNHEARDYIAPHKPLVEA